MSNKKAIDFLLRQKAPLFLQDNHLFSPVDGEAAVFAGVSVTGESTTDPTGMAYPIDKDALRAVLLQGPAPVFTFSPEGAVLCNNVLVNEIGEFTVDYPDPVARPIPPRAPFDRLSPSVAQGPCLEVPPAVLKSLCGFALERRDSTARTYALSYLCFSPAGNGVDVVASEAHSMVIYHMDGVRIPEEVLVSVEVVRRAVQFSPRDGIRITFSPGGVVLSGDGWGIHQLPVEATYPEWRRVVPPVGPGVLAVYADEAASMFGKAGSLAERVVLRPTQHGEGVGLEPMVVDKRVAQFVLAADAVRCPVWSCRAGHWERWLRVHDGHVVEFRFAEREPHCSPVMSTVGPWTFVTMPYLNQEVPEEMARGYARSLSAPRRALAPREAKTARRAPSYKAVVAWAKDHPEYREELLKALGGLRDGGE